MNCDANFLRTAAACLVCLSARVLARARLVLLCAWANNLTPPVSPPVIILDPQDTTQPVGGTAIFTVTATGDAPLQYQWKKNGVPLSDGGNISGSQTDTLTINPVGTSDADTYSVTVSNGGGSVASSPATLTVPVNDAVISLDGTSTHTAVKLDITNAFPPDTYEVWKSTDGGDTYSLYDTINGLLTSYTDGSSMTSGNLWMYKLKSTGLSGYSNIAGPAAYLQYGGAVTMHTFGTDPKALFFAFAATVNDDGSVPFNGSMYTSPIAGSRGAALINAINDFNLQTGTPGHTPTGTSIWMSAHHFDVGGSWVAQPRYYLFRSSTIQVGLGIFGQGSGSTFVHISSPTTTWGPVFNFLVYSDGTIVKDFAVNQYYDGPDEHYAPVADGAKLWMKGVISDNTRCRTGGVVTKGGFLAGGTPDGSGLTMLNNSNSGVAFSATIIDSTMYSGSRFVDAEVGAAVLNIDCYGSGFFRIFDGAYGEDFNLGIYNTATVAHLRLFQCIIDGGNHFSWGVTSNSNACDAYLYNTTTFQNRRSDDDNWDLTDLADFATIFVTNSVVWSRAVVDPPGDAGPDPVYSPPSLPAALPDYALTPTFVP